MGWSLLLSLSLFCRLSVTVVPLKRLKLFPFNWRNRSCSFGAMYSISFLSSASWSVKDFDSRTALSANVPACEDEEPGGCGAAAAGRHVDDDRHRRGHDFLDDFARRIDQSAGSVDLDQDGLIVVGGCRGEGAANVFGGDGLNGVVHCDPKDVGGAGHSKK